MFQIKLNKYNIKESNVITNIELLHKPDFLCLSGSRAYGTDTEDSDIDIRGFVFPPSEHILGINRFEQHESIYSNTDIVVWSVNKFISMLLKGGSVATEMLFCPDKAIITKSELAEEILRNRSIFISKCSIIKNLGYSYSEWGKLRGESTRKLGELRKRDIERYGYSIRNAYHAIRILTQTEQLLDLGVIFFPLANSSFLKAVKLGDVPFVEVEKVYTDKLKRIEDGLRTSVLQEKPNYDRVNKLLCQLNLRKILYNLVPVKSYELPFYHHQ